MIILKYLRLIIFSEFLKKHSIKVALSGLGADEIFYGYNKYYVAKKYEDENFFKK